MTTLSQRGLNRATLARQFLLERADVEPVRAIESLTALQAQSARSPFIALWSRIREFDADSLRRAIDRRKVVKSTLMRSTLHLTSARDYTLFRPALHASLVSLAAGMLRGRMQDVDVDLVVKAVRGFLADEPRTFAEIFTLLEERFPDADVRALGYTARLHVPLVQIPAETRWSFPASPARFGLAEEWLGKTVPSDGPAKALVLRYLGSLGPATVADISNWTGLRGVREVVDGLNVLRFRNEDGKEVLDLPDAPRPPADTPAPVRFLPEFDNIVLSGADRSRFMTKEQQRAIFTNNLAYAATFLVDGQVAGAWRVDRKRKTLVVEPFATPKKATRDAVADEALALASFLDPEYGVSFP